MTVSSTSSSSIDVASIVSQLMQTQQQPLTNLQTAMTKLQSQVSTFGTLKSQLAALQDASQQLTSLATWKGTTGTSSDSTVASVSTSSGATPGTYSIGVQQLAQGQAAITGQYAGSTAVLGGGTLTIQMGTVGAGGTGFTAGSTAAANITIPSGATLAQVQSAINGAGVGVTANLVSDGSGTRLMLRSTSTGAGTAFQVSVSGAEDGSSTGLGGLSFTPGGGGGNMTGTQTAQDAQYTLNGLQLTSATNTVQNAIDGLNVTLSKVSTSPVSVSVGTDTSGIEAQINKFVSAYNTVAQTLQTDTAYDASTQTAGPLLGNFAANQVQSRLYSLLNTTVGTGSYNNLTAIGITMAKDGTLSFNTSKFESAMNADPGQVQSLLSTTTTFNADGTTNTTNGIAAQFSSMISDALGVNGSIGNALQTLNTQETQNQSQQTTVQARLALIQQRLTAQYTQLNTTLTQMSATSASLTTSLASILNSNSGK